MTRIQTALLAYLLEQSEYYRHSRRLYMSPQERQERITFFEESIEELKQLVGAVSMAEEYLSTKR